MEMMAVIEAFKALKEPCHVLLHSDSALIINTFEQGWIDNWIAKSWVKSDKKPVENRDLWEEMLEVMESHKVSWIKVKAHHTDERNNRVDAKAVEESRKYVVL
jgi:ribonuclease HI